MAGLGAAAALPEVSTPVAVAAPAVPTTALPIAPSRSLLDVNSIIKNMRDRGRGSLYDHVRLKAGSLMPDWHYGFQVPVGQVDPDSCTPKTFSDTNMLSGGMMHPPYDMLVQRFLFLLHPSVLAEDRDALLSDYAWEFTVMEKVKVRQPLLVGSATGTSETCVDGFGERTCYDLEQFPIYLPPLVHFGVSLRGKSFQLKGDLDLRVILDGLRDYPVC